MAALANLPTPTPRFPLARPAAREARHLPHVEDEAGPRPLPSYCVHHVTELSRAVSGIWLYARKCERTQRS